eukprot:366576-Chlamydomonas_euryale.AAC.11
MCRPSGGTSVLIARGSELRQAGGIRRGSRVLRHVARASEKCAAAAEPGCTCTVQGRAGPARSLRQAKQPLLAG